MRTGVIIEARMASSRLPGKIMLPAVGKPLLGLLIERLQRATEIDAIIVATTTSHRDTVIAALAAEAGVQCYRGSEDDVLSRVLEAAQEYAVDSIVEITSDCPLADPAIVDKALKTFKGSDLDYYSNHILRTYPLGLDMQIFRTRVLEDVSRRTNDARDREHVSLYIYEHPEIYALQNFTTDLPLPEARLTLDTPEDYFLIKKIFEHFYPGNPCFSYEELYHFLKDNPALMRINAGVQQKRARAYDPTQKARAHLGLE